MRKFKIVTDEELIEIMEKNKLINCGMSGIFPKLHWYIKNNCNEIEDIYCI